MSGDNKVVISIATAQHALIALNAVIGGAYDDRHKEAARGALGSALDDALHDDPAPAEPSRYVRGVHGEHDDPAPAEPTAEDEGVAAARRLGEQHAEFQAAIVRMGKAYREALDADPSPREASTPEPADQGEAPEDMARRIGGPWVFNDDTHKWEPPAAPADRTPDAEVVHEAKAEALIETRDYLRRYGSNGLDAWLTRRAHAFSTRDFGGARFTEPASGQPDGDIDRDALEAIVRAQVEAIEPDVRRALMFDHGCIAHAGPGSGACRSCVRRAQIVMKELIAALAADGDQTKEGTEHDVPYDGRPHEWEGDR